MITDGRQIQSAIDRVLARKMYVALTRETFEEVCPHPSMAVHVLARSADEAAILLRIELAGVDPLSLSGAVAFVQSHSLTMQGLERIMSAFPRSKRFKAGISAVSPAGGAVEVWFFADLSRV